MKSYSFKDSKKDDTGRKTTITITTENPEVIKKLIESTASGSNSKSSTSSKKKDSMNAEVKEAKKKQEKKKTQLLNAPAKVASKPQASNKTLKLYSCEDKDLKGGLVIYAPSKDKAIKLIAALNKILATNYKIVESVRGKALKTTNKYNLTVDNYYQLQVDQAKKMAAQWKKENKKPFEGLRRK